MQNGAWHSDAPFCDCRDEGAREWKTHTPGKRRRTGPMRHFRLIVQRAFRAFATLVAAAAACTTTDIISPRPSAPRQPVATTFPEFSRWSATNVAYVFADAP